MNFETDDLEVMWCDRTQGCWCWEFGCRNPEHLEKCGLHADDESCQDWYEEDYE